MPIYEYACETCGHRFERRQRFSDEPVAECPECGSSVRRVLHPAGVIFKGSGWYVTDSRKPSGGESSGDKSASTDKAPASDGAKVGKSDPVSSTTKS
ncbi:MAG TPA: FmdB family zinc ribbon protein [Thermomicrobiaceae bacterium]|nr:FmdB family zinc ribbon protein [Thermomicrobiaceae bacterium]